MLSNCYKYWMCQHLHLKRTDYTLTNMSKDYEHSNRKHIYTFTNKFYANHCINLQSYCKWRFVSLHSLEIFWKEQVQTQRQSKWLNAHAPVESTITFPFMACRCSALQVSLFCFLKKKNTKFMLFKTQIYCTKNKTRF